MVDMNREDLANMIDARANMMIRAFDELVIMPRHRENTSKLDDNIKKTDQVLEVVNKAKGSIRILAWVAPILASILTAVAVAVLNHLWK